jgi:hypothetical protein
MRDLKSIIRCVAGLRSFNGLSLPEEEIFFSWLDSQVAKPQMPKPVPAFPDRPVDDTVDDEDDDTEQQTKTCPVCNGRGRTHDGLTCDECGGSGRVPVDDFGDDGEEQARSFYGHIEDEE